MVSTKSNKKQTKNKQNKQNQTNKQKTNKTLNKQQTKNKKRILFLHFNQSFLYFAPNETKTKQKTKPEPKQKNKRFERGTQTFIKTSTCCHLCTSFETFFFVLVWGLGFFVWFGFCFFFFVVWGLFLCFFVLVCFFLCWFVFLLLGCVFFVQGCNKVLFFCVQNVSEQNLCLSRSLVSTNSDAPC